MKNMEIRNAAKKAGLKMWQVARLAGYSSSWFSVLMREEFKPDKKQALLDKIAAEKAVKQ